MKFVLEILGVLFATLLFLGVLVNNLIYPLNIVGVIGVLAYAIHVIKTVIKNDKDNRK